MSILWFDLETYSECDLKKAGAHRYAEDPTTEVLLFGYALDDEPADVWDATQGPMPSRLDAILRDPDVQLRAHNCAFDSQLINVTLGYNLPVTRYFCTMAMAMTLGLPASLAELGTVVGLSEKDAKLKEGKRLVRRFCLPQPKNHKVKRWTRETDPENWRKFIDYARQDVAAMRQIVSRLPNYNYKDGELALWHLDQKINNTGLPIDLPLVDACLELIDYEIDNLQAQTLALTNGMVENTKSRAKALAWISQQGVNMPGYTKKDVEDALQQDLPDNVRKFLEIRQQEGRAATAKFTSITNSVCADGTVKGTLQYYGASRTGRWAGRRLQIQNLYKSPYPVETLCRAIKEGPGVVHLLYDDGMSVAAGAVRPAIAAPPGYDLLVSDFAGIEARITAAVACEGEALTAFCQQDNKTGPGIYELEAGRIYNVRPSEIKKGDKRRDVGKAATLALGFGGGAGAFGSMALNFGLDLAPTLPALLSASSDYDKERALFGVDWLRDKQPDKFKELGYDATYAASLIKNKWRDSNPNIVQFWYDIENAARSAIAETNRMFWVNSIGVGCDGKFLRIKLPSGRFLCYPAPRISSEGDLMFSGVDQYTRKWTRIKTYGGKLTENLVQGIARDLMANALFNLDNSGFTIIGSVHDEAICLAPEGHPALTGEAMTARMESTPAWARTWPIVAETDVWKRYQK